MTCRGELHASAGMRQIRLRRDEFALSTLPLRARALSTQLVTPGEPTAGFSSDRNAAPPPDARARDTRRSRRHDPQLADDGDSPDRTKLP
jgi:hypothetical protein